MTWKVMRGALVAGLVAAVVGCGESKPLTRAEFVKQATAVCQGTRTQFAVYVRQLHDHKISGAQLRADYADLLRADARSLAELDPPEPLQDSFKRFVAAHREQAEAMIARATGGTRADALRQERATHIAVPLSRRLGLTGC